MKASIYFFFILFISWSCSLEKIDPSVKYDPCLGKVISKFSHDKLGISCDSPCVVKFTNQSTGAKNYTWNFGEGGTSTDANPTYIFKKTGRFEVKLVATGDNGCRNESTQIVTVTSQNVPNPIADFTFTYIGGSQFAPATVAFTNTSQNASNYCWYANDSPFSELNNPIFTFNQPGDYTIKLVAKNTAGTQSPPKIQIVTIKRITFEVTPPGFGPAQRVVALSTGEFVVAGTNYISGTTKSDAYIFKTDANGTVQTGFTKIFDLSDKDVLTDMIQLTNGDFVLCGSTLSVSNTNTDGFYARVRPDGSISLSATRFGDINRDGYPFSMLETTDGYIVFAGTTNTLASGNNDVWLTKRSPTNINTLLFDSTYSAPQAEVGNDVEWTTDGLLIFGTASPIAPGSNTQSFILKTDANGKKLNGFPKTISKPEDYSYAKTIGRMTSGKFVLGGDISPSGGEYKGWLNVIDGSGNISSGFPKNIGATGFKEQIQDVQEISSDFICVGTKGNNGAWVAKVNASGVVTKDTMFGTVNTNIFNAVRPTLDGALIMVGSKAGSAYMVRFKL